MKLGRRALLVAGIVLLTQNIYAQNGSIFAQQKPKLPKIYSIGTGLSLNYFSKNVGLMVDSYHFFNTRANQRDRALLRVGMGMNYNLESSALGFMANVSVGYMYVMDNVELGSLESFGTGVSLDYQYISPDTHNAGATLYISLEQYLLGLGAGVTFTGVQKGSPYVKFDFAITF